MNDLLQSQACRAGVGSTVPLKKTMRQSEQHCQTCIDITNSPVSLTKTVQQSLREATLTVRGGHLTVRTSLLLLDLSEKQLRQLEVLLQLSGTNSYSQIFRWTNSNSRKWTSDSRISQGTNSDGQE
jgi:hypothetical protein